MNTYVAFLRAINVGGHVVKMDELKRIFNSLGLKNVRTYIQSGNVIFETASKNIPALCKKIENSLFKELQYEVPAMVRTTAEVQEIAENHPFKNLSLPEGTKTYVSFLADEPDIEHSRMLLNLNNDDTTFHLKNREIFSRVSKRAAEKAPFSNSFLEKKFGIPATTRNLTIPGKIIQFLNGEK